METIYIKCETESEDVLHDQHIHQEKTDQDKEITGDAAAVCGPEDKHTLDKPHKCDVCDYSATQEWILKRHIRAKHSLKKPHKCDECNYSATTAWNLKIHIQAKHSLEKPHKCDECDHSAVSASALKTHIQAKHSFKKASQVWWV